MAKTKLDIIYVDEHLIVVNKPPGTLSIPDRFKADIPNLQTMLIAEYGDIYTVHRLDKFTSGVILFARDAESHRYLSDLWMDRKPEKYYTAVVDGVPREKQGTIELALTESMARRGKMLAHKRGKESKTTYTVAEEFGQAFSLIDLRIYTGRMHQIRVHMAEIGHPLVIDDLYGRRAEFMLSEVKGRKFNLRKDEDERPLIVRQPLHAARLVIEHPATKKMMTFEAELPKDMRALINQLRKNTK